MSDVHSETAGGGSPRSGVTVSDGGVSTTPFTNRRDLLGALQKGGALVSIRLKSGVKLRGEIKSFDKYSVVLNRGGLEQLVFLHGLSTISTTVRGRQLKWDFEGMPEGHPAEALGSSASGIELQVDRASAAGGDERQRTETGSPVQSVAPDLSGVHQTLIGDWLGIESPVSEAEILRVIEERLDTEAIERLATLGLERVEISDSVIPARTLQHRRSRRERLTIEESDRVLRMMRVLSTAQDVYGSREGALAWLRNPHGRLQGRTPLSLLKTDTGSRIVEELLVQVDEGMFV